MQYSGKLKKGIYIAKPKSADSMRAMANGLVNVYPEAEMHFDGSWCRFFKDGQQVWQCNPFFAEHNFVVKKVKDGKELNN